MDRRPYLGTGLTDKRENFRGDAHWPSEGYGQLKLRTFTFNCGGHPPDLPLSVEQERSSVDVLSRSAQSHYYHKAHRRLCRIPTST